MNELYQLFRQAEMGWWTEHATLVTVGFILVVAALIAVGEWAGVVTLNGGL